MYHRKPLSKIPAGGDVLTSPPPTTPTPPTPPPSPSGWSTPCTPPRSYSLPRTPGTSPYSPLTPTSPPPRLVRRSGTGTNLRRTARLKLRIARLEALAARRAAHDALHKDQQKPENGCTLFSLRTRRSGQRSGTQKSVNVVIWLLMMITGTHSSRMTTWKPLSLEVFFV